MLVITNDIQIASTGFFSIFILLYFSQDTLLFGTNKNNAMFWLKNIVLVFLCLQLLYTSIKKRTIIQKKPLIVFIFISLFALLTLILSGDEPTKYFFEIVTFFTALLLSAQLDFHKFVEHYVKTILCISVFSLVVSAIYLFAYPMLSIFPIIENKSGHKFYNLFFSLAMTTTPYVPYRNYGIFREPGVYAIFLTIALIFELFGDKRIRIKRISIFISTILSTLSSAGYILLILVMGAFLLAKQNGVRYFQFKFLITIFLLLSGLLLLFENSIYNLVFDKFYSPNSSANSRVGSILVNLHIFFDNIKHLFFGAGYGYVERNFSRISIICDIIAGDNTNTILKMLAVHGIWFTSVCGVMIYKFWKSFSRNKLLIVTLFFLFVVALSNEDIIFNLILYMLVFYGAASNNVRSAFACELQT